MSTALEITRHPDRFAALCGLWRRERATVWLTLQGCSMLPEIPPGSRVQVDCGDAAPSVGQIVAALHGSQLVIHRVVRVDTESAATPLYICQGDANNFTDLPVVGEQILGIVCDYRKPTIFGRLQRTWSRLLLSRSHALTNTSQSRTKRSNPGQI